MKHPPQSPEELNALLVAIFPAFSCSSEEPERLNSASFHSIMAEFAYFFGKGASTFSEKQLAQLSEFLVLASKQKNPLENAVDTCFLKHTRQISQPTAGTVVGKSQG